jgi:hypothetical protein
MVLQARERLRSDPAYLGEWISSFLWEKKMRTIDLTEMNVWVDDYRIVDESRGWAGSWHEPAEPPAKEYHIRKLTLEGLDAWDASEIKDVLSIAEGDQIKVDLLFEDQNGMDVEVRSEAVVGRVIHNPKRHEIELVVENLYARWEGNPPPQSHRGRESA